ncbi:uncharacterized protein [Aphelocoma coerulescens]|uniref:uncharacterized protein n=1 Tax=Aphelocoma coerulescens TaxID=39617 RepID=UPI0036047032
MQMRSRLLSSPPGAGRAPGECDPRPESCVARSPQSCRSAQTLRSPCLGRPPPVPQPRLSSSPRPERSVGSGVGEAQWGLGPVRHSGVRDRSSSKAAKCHLKSRTASSGRVPVVPADCCIKTKCQGWIQEGKFYWINGQETVKQPFLFKMHEELQGRNGEVLSYRWSCDHGLTDSSLLSAMKICMKRVIKNPKPEWNGHEIVFKKTRFLWVSLKCGPSVVHRV